MYEIILGRDEEDRKLFGERGTFVLGKNYVRMGQTTSLSNPILMDAARSHVVFVCGKRGSGKSFSMGVIAEGLMSLPEDIKQNLAVLIVDTMGIYWTTEYPNNKDKDMLKAWDLVPRGIVVDIYVPQGFFKPLRDKGIPIDYPFSVKPSELSVYDWCDAFGIDLNSEQGVLIARVVEKLGKKDFAIQDVIEAAKADSQTSDTVKSAVENLFSVADSWGLFSKEGTAFKDVLKPGRITVLDVSCYTETAGRLGIRSLVVALVAKKLFAQRMTVRRKEELSMVKKGTTLTESSGEKNEYPLVWMMVDECLAEGTEIITSEAHTQIQDIVRKFNEGEKFKVLGFDEESKRYDYYDVTRVYSKGKREVIKLTTETGKEIKCTPEHRVLTRHGFFSAFSVDEIATPAIQHYSTDKECVKARITGQLFGDGWATEKQQSLGFSGKINSDDLNKIKNDLLLLGLKSSNVHSRKTKSIITTANNQTLEVSGTSHSIQASSKAYKFFKQQGIILGDKTLSESKVPEWIKNSNEKVKSEFLAALMGSDGYKISKAKNARGDFNAIRFSFNKREELKENAIFFANELKALFESIGIKISSISIKQGNIRKDGNKTIKITLILGKSVENTINFLERAGYRYCSEKEVEGIKWLSYLKSRLFLKREREKIYRRAIQLRKKGLGKIKISKLLKFPEAQIRDWIYSDVKPGLPKGFPDMDEWIKNRQQGDLLFERVVKMEQLGEEEVYDVSVDKVHNFVSNGFVTHNCHEFLPNKGSTIATAPLLTLLREGRQPGISLVLATQQPGKIHTDVMTQADVVISHIVTAKVDTDALGTLMQSYMREDLNKMLQDLPRVKGAALAFDDINERMHIMRVRPRVSWHGGGSPTPIKESVSLF